MENDKFKEEEEEEESKAGFSFSCVDCSGCFREFPSLQTLLFYFEPMQITGRILDFLGSVFRCFFYGRVLSARGFQETRLFSFFRRNSPIGNYDEMMFGGK